MLIGIIEDDKLLNQALRLVLQKAGYRIICAHTRQEALSLMGREEDLLLVDILLLVSGCKKDGGNLSSSLQFLI